MRPEPYITKPPLVRWGPPLLLVSFALYLALGRDPVRPWAAIAVLVFAAAVLAYGVDALRTDRVEFPWVGWRTFTADRDRAPVRFWLMTAGHWAFGLLVLAIALADAVRHFAE